MSQYAIIADNGGSDLRYNDIVGEVYTFPSRYLNYLPEGTKFVYQRCGLSSMKVQEPDKERLLDEPHYFGVAEIGTVKYVGDDRYEAQIINYKHFVKGVPFRLMDGSHFEIAAGQFWRNGVRITVKEVYDEILKASTGVIPETSPLAGLIPPEKPRVPVITKQTNLRKTARNRSSVQIKDTVEVFLRSASFADDCLEIVTDRKSYWLHSIAEDKYYLLAPIQDMDYKVGKISIGRYIVQKEPRVLSDKMFSIIHIDSEDKTVIGSIEITNNEIQFRGNNRSEKTMDVVHIPIDMTMVG